MRYLTSCRGSAIFDRHGDAGEDPSPGAAGDIHEASRGHAGDGRPCSSDQTEEISHVVTVCTT